LWEFHQQQRQSLHPSFEALKTAWTVAHGEQPGLGGFLSRFGALSFRFGGLDAFERLAKEAVSDAADDGVVHLEISFNPIFAARRMKDFSLAAAPEPDSVIDEAAQAIVQGARNEAARRGLSIVFILVMPRDKGMDVSRATAAIFKRQAGN